MLNEIYTILKKEFRHIKRDKRVLSILIFFPALLLVLNGYAMNFDVTNVEIAIYDENKTNLSREFISAFVNSGYFEITNFTSSHKELENFLNDGKIKCGIIIPKNFSQKILSNSKTEVAFIIDGSDVNVASIIYGYVEAITTNFSQKILLKTISQIGQLKIPIETESRIWFNPELKSSKFLVPGLLGLILTISSVIATSLSIVREKEKNTIEQLNISPIHPFSFILGKLIPYLIIAFISAQLTLFASYFMFDVVVKGSYILLSFVTLLFIVCCLGLGIWVSTISNNQQVAFQIASLISLLPTVVLSGFMFPIRSMPNWLQMITNIIPAKFYLIILRSIILKGVGIKDFLYEVLFLFIFATVILTISSLRLKKQLS